MFSPYYFWSGRRDPYNHVAINVAVYGRKASRWAMTERGRRALVHDRSSFAVGPSQLRWDGYTLAINVDEVSAPIPARVRGRIRLYPEALASQDVSLDRAGLHVWQPIAPRARIEVEFTNPGVRWQGHGYFDHNRGEVPLERSFRDWNWSRATLADGAAVLYEGHEKDGAAFNLALRFDRDACAVPVAPPDHAPLSSTPIFWMPRGTRSDEGHHPQVKRTLEDAPFYARSILSTRLFGERVAAVHESLSLTRLDSAIVRQMLPYRMPRAIF